VSRDPATSPAVSLVVCTRDRAASLPACLDAIAAMRPALSWELVLVDNDSSDETPRVLADFAASAPFPVSLVRESRRGLASARNAGVRVARAPLLAFTDDDCYPASDYLDAWAAVFDDPAVSFGGGRVLLHDPDDYPITIRTDTEPTPVEPHGFIEPGLVQGANMAFRRDVVLALGGFDPALGPGGLFNFEDLDMASRAAAAGYAGGYFPGPVVRHHHRRRLMRDVEALQRSYDGGRGAYFASLLLRRQAPRALARHLRASLAYKTAGVVLRELKAAAHYVVYRARRPRERQLDAATRAG
jgi:glycosyltransferase involved in cell wall biosynthesis